MHRSSTERDDVTLIQISIATRNIALLVDGFDLETFGDDMRTHFAVINQLQVVGEAVKRLSMGFRDSHPDIEWRAIAGMRDELIHGYDRIDLEQVWNAATISVPNLRAYLAPHIPIRPIETDE